MVKTKVLVYIGILALILSACSSQAGVKETVTSIPQVPVATQTSSPGIEVPTVTSQLVESTEQPVDYCLQCHTNKQMLMDTAKTEEEQVNENKGMSLVGNLPVMEPWQKVLVDSEKFPNSIHGLNGCISCHGGVQTPEKDAAHQGIVSNPSKDAKAVCGQCHPDIVKYHENSLHTNLTGFWTDLDARRESSNHANLEQAFNDQCEQCHTTCGECHVSRPNVAGGGFVNGHLFNRQPSMAENCVACHASRVGNEYMGNNSGVEADVHFRQGEMVCLDCHTGSELHGAPANCASCHPGPESATVAPPDHRLSGIQSPRCESCHPNVSAGQDGVIYHEMHGANLSCQVCHSVEYTSCDGCHVAKDSQTGTPFYELDSSYPSFLIGRNPIQTYERPYRYVPVRHVPVSRDSFNYYGENLLPNYDKLETWKYATPHNIQLKTPQTESCNACHGNPAWFLTADKVSADELTANKSVIVEQVPSAITSRSQFP